MTSTVIYLVCATVNITLAFFAISADCREVAFMPLGVLAALSILHFAF